MKAFLHPLTLAALAVCALAFAAAGPMGLVVVSPLCVAALALVVVSASNGGAQMPARRLPHWLDVAAYRALCVAASLRDAIGRALFAAQVRLGSVACMAFPGSVAADLAFGIIGEQAFDGPTRTQPARINHGTAADIVIGRWFTLAADGTARPGGAGAIGGVFMLPKTQSSLGTAGGGALAATLTVPTNTVGEFLYMGQIIVALGAAVAIGDAGKYNTTTGVILSGAPGAGEAAIPNSRFIRYANAAAGLAVLELTN